MGNHLEDLCLLLHQLGELASIEEKEVYPYLGILSAFIHDWQEK